MSVALAIILLLLLWASGLGIGPSVSLSDKWLLWVSLSPCRFPFVMGLVHECYFYVSSTH